MTAIHCGLPVFTGKQISESMRRVFYQMGSKKRVLNLSFLKSQSFPLVEQVRPTSAKIDDLGTPVPILFQPCALGTIVSITYTRATADDTSSTVCAKIALIAYPNQGLRSDVRIANRTLSITFLAHARDRDPRLFSTLNQVRMMLGHDWVELSRRITGVELDVALLIAGRVSMRLERGLVAGLSENASGSFCVLSLTSLSL